MLHSNALHCIHSPLQLGHPVANMTCKTSTCIQRGVENSWPCESETMEPQHRRQRHSCSDSARLSSVGKQTSMRQNLNSRHSEWLRILQHQFAIVIHCVILLDICFLNIHQRTCMRMYVFPGHISTCPTPAMKTVLVHIDAFTPAPGSVYALQFGSQTCGGF